MKSARYLVDGKKVGRFEFLEIYSYDMAEAANALVISHVANPGINEIMQNPSSDIERGFPLYLISNNLDKCSLVCDSTTIIDRFSRGFCRLKRPAYESSKMQR